MRRRRSTFFYTRVLTLCPHMLKIIATTCLDTFPRTGRSGGLPRLPSALLEGGVPHNRGGNVTDLRIYYYYYSTKGEDS